MLALSTAAPAARAADGAPGSGSNGSGAPSAVVVDEPSAPAPIVAPDRRTGATTARIVAPTVARSRAGGGRRIGRVSTGTSWSGQPRTLLVLESTMVGERQWLKVLLATRPNGATGWIPADDTVLGRTRTWVTLRLAARELRVYRSGRLVSRHRAVIGQARTPTPLGLSAVYEQNRQPDPRGFYGPWVLSLSSLSPTIFDFGGGPGRIAIHGRAGASLGDPLGSARSHGCVRIDNAAIRALARIATPGTPVEVVR